ncbi:MAG: DUF4394 domain-containing protein [Fimbriiglobus sp.]
MLPNWLRQLFPDHSSRKSLRRKHGSVRLATCPRLVPLEDRVTPATLFGLSSNTLVRFDSATPNTIDATVTITGVAAGESLVGIDFRAQNGFLYGLGVNPTSDNATLYTISTRTGLATAVGAPGSIAFTDLSFNPIDLPDPATTGYGIDFNPAADRIRVVAGSLNFRVNPNTGAPIDGNLDGTAPNPINGTNPDAPVNGNTTTVDATAYTNNQPNNGNLTTQYTLDSATNQLFIQTPPNSGTQVNPGGTPIPLTLGGNPLDFTGVNGFDIPAGVNVTTSGQPVTSGSAFAVLTVGTTSGLYGINLTNGVATLLGNVGTGATALQGVAVQSDLGGSPAISLSADGTQLLRFNTATPSTVTTISITGLATNERLVGIDFRPATGQLIGLAINVTASPNNGTLYLVDPQTAAARPLVPGTVGAITFADAGGAPVALADPATTGYGFDFNPTVDRIRVTNSAGQNFRLNPLTGLGIDGNPGAGGTQMDTAINGGSVTGVSATAYTNSFGQPLMGGVTSQYTLDAASNSLFIQFQPNSGTQTNGITVTLNGALLDFTDISGFDIPAGVKVVTSGDIANGLGYAVLTVGATTSLYSIDLNTGAATNLGAVGAGATALAGLALANAEPANLVINGTAGNDTLVLTATGADSGSFSLNGGPTIPFSDVISLTFLGNGGNDDVVFNLPSTQSGVVLEDDGTAANGFSQLRSLSSTFVRSKFTNLNQLTINRGTANDKFRTTALPDFNGRLMIGTLAAPLEMIDFVGAMSLGLNKSLTGFANTINVSANVSTVGGLGSISLTAQRDILVSAGKVLSATDGTITLSANQQATPTAGNYSGLVISGTVQTTDGSINLLGRGGVDGDTNIGVSVEMGGLVQAGGAGSITVIGVGGGLPASAGSNDGINVAGNILAGGDLTMTGTGGTGGFSSGIIAFQNLTAGGNAKLTGTGGTGTNAPDGINVGVFLFNTILTANGFSGVVLDGTGGAGPIGSSDGVLFSTATVNAPNGPVIASGRAGAGPGSFGIRHSGGETNAKIIELNTDTLDIDSSSKLIGVEYIAVRPLTDGRTIVLGGADSTTTFGVSDVELPRLFAPVVFIGWDKSGSIATNAELTTATGASLTLLTSKDITITNPITASGNFIARAGNNFSLATGKSITTGASKFITIEVDTIGPADANGGTVTINGDLIAPGGATIIGGIENDTVEINTALTAPTTVLTGAGADTIRFGNGASLNGGTIDAGADIDTIDYSAFTTGVSVNLGTNATDGKFTSSLNGLQENPAIVTTADGTFTVTYNPLTRQATVTGTVNNLTNPIVDFHIHRQGVGVNGPVIVGIGAAVFVPTGTPGQFTVNVVATIPAAHEAAFLGGLTYFNIHTNPGFPGGEIRGQIVPSGVFVAASGTATGTGGIAGIENAIGGAGADSLVGDGLANILTGNAGNDTIVGARGNDTMLGGNDNDDIVWSNGDNNDIIDGGDGVDRVTVNGAVGGGDAVTIGAGSGGRLAFARTNLVPFTLDIGTTETFVFNGYAGDDTIAVNELTGVLDLNRIDLNGLAGNDTFNVTPSAVAVVNVTGYEQTTGDLLSVSGAGLTLTNTKSTGVEAQAGTFTAAGKQPINFRMIEAGVSQVSIADATVVEGTGGTTNLVFTLSLSAPSSQTITVDFTLNPGTAINIVDYTSSTGTVTFAPGETTQTITVAIIADNIDENDETFSATLLSALNATILNGTATGTITDDDAPPTISISDTSALESGGFIADAVFTLTLSAPSSFPITVNYTTRDGSALATADYTASSGTVTFAPGQTVQTILVPILPDDLDEIDEDFDVSLSGPTNATIADGDAIGTIEDDDLPPTISIGDATIVEGDTGTRTMTFVVTLSAASSKSVTVDFQTLTSIETKFAIFIPPTPFELENLDIVDQSGTLTFAPGVTSQTITVTVRGDTIVEANERLAVNLRNASNATLDLSDAQGIGTITDDDSATISISTGGASQEGVDRVFTITLSNPVDVPVSVRFSTLNGTAVSGSKGDFVAIANQLVTFAPGETSRTITVTVNDDDTPESVETFAAVINSLEVMGRDVTLAKTTAIASITDNDVEIPSKSLLPTLIRASTPNNGSTGTILRTFTANGKETTSTVPFPGFNGSLSTAQGDVNGDGVLDLVVGAGFGGGPHVKVFDGKTNAELRSFFAYDPSFTGGVNVAIGDINSDGKADIVTGTGVGGGPHVRVFDGATASELRSFFAYETSFRGGVNVAAGDVDGDSKADIVTGAGPGGGPHIKVFSGATSGVLQNFFAFAPSFAGGVNVAVGDLNGDGLSDIITGAGPGGGPHIRAFQSLTSTPLFNTFVGDPSFTGGIDVAIVDPDGVDSDDDGVVDIVTGAGAGGGPRVRVFNISSTTPISDFLIDDITFRGGVDVG